MEFDFIFILKEKLTSILWVPLSLSSPFHFVYILTYSFLALIIFLKKNPKTSFSLKNLVSYCFPRKIYLHSSFLLDLKIYFFILVVIPGHVYLKIFSIPALSLSGLQYLIKVVGVNESPFSYSPLMAPFIFLFFFLMADFSTYLTHRLEHQVPFLWKFHALHHNALVLNPLTVYRVHPISILFKTVSAMIFRTIGNIVLVYLFKGEVGFLTLIGNGLLPF
jgi:sterol desaturase/sphingolipid hydroxylase (fatty acid hydroxylase superfamily)